jgi:hypothetical protein
MLPPVNAIADILADDPCSNLFSRQQLKVFSASAGTEIRIVRATATDRRILQIMIFSAVGMTLVEYQAVMFGGQEWTSPWQDRHHS